VSQTAKKIRIQIDLRRAQQVSGRERDSENETTDREKQFDIVFRNVDVERNWNWDGSALQGRIEVEKNHRGDRHEA
jgi:hypothetical protein